MNGHDDYRDLTIETRKRMLSAFFMMFQHMPVRFNQMRRYLGDVTDRTLSANLRELEADGLVVRRAYDQVPPRVEYSLTELGDSLMVVFDQLCTWGEDRMGD